MLPWTMTVPFLEKLSASSLDILLLNYPKHTPKPFMVPDAYQVYFPYCRIQGPVHIAHSNPTFYYLSMNTLCSFKLNHFQSPNHALQFLTPCLCSDVLGVLFVLYLPSLPLHYPSTPISACHTPTTFLRIILNVTSSMKPFLF